MLSCDPIERPAYCHDRSWLYLKSASASCPPPRNVYRPCGRCGHGADEHDHDPITGGCMHHDASGLCVCAIYRYPTKWDQVHAPYRSDVSCEDTCPCADHHPPGGRYYVSARQGEEHVLVLGPYVAHGVALGDQSLAVSLAEHVDRRAWGYAWGTYVVRAPGPYSPGLLNDRPGSPFAP